MAALHTASQWLEALVAGDVLLNDDFRRHTAFVMPCISPDGFVAMMNGSAYIRSKPRPPPEGTVRVGFEECDVDGDGVVRSMRWRHPAGPFVEDEAVPGFMRPRTLDDSPSKAFFLSGEGSFLRWDGVKWSDAPLQFGLDLNRNFPAHWEPFRMFGMHGGDVPLAEVESRTVVDAFRARRGIAVGLTNHTYTGALLTQPYRDPSPLGVHDIDVMEALAKEAVEGTGYKVIRVHPDFVYDPKKAIVGVWADTMATVFGVPGYTLELWDPYSASGVEVKKPAEFFRAPDPDLVRKIVQHFKAADASCFADWKPFEHPQLGPVEIGGIDYMRTIRNPPLSVLPAECARGFRVADRLRRALPRLRATLTRQDFGADLWRVEVVLENVGFLPTCGLSHAESMGFVPPIAVELVLPAGVDLLDGEREQTVTFLEGWGSLKMGAARHPIYAGLGGRGVRGGVHWQVRGGAPVEVRWTAPRSGSGSVRG